MVKRAKTTTRRLHSEVDATTRRPPTLIPPEICAIICDIISTKRGLRALCMVSRTFRSQGERLLYHSVDLRVDEKEWGSTRRLKSWSTSTSKNPYLGEYVHSLVLQLPLSLEPSITSKLGRALALCVNLKELRVFGPSENPRYGSFQGSLLNKCSFRLTKFVNHYFDEGSIMAFWRNQTELHLLDCERNVCALDPVAKLLPNIIAIKTNDIGNLPVGRALQRIETSLLVYIPQLKRYETSLTTLNLWQPRWQVHWLKQPREGVIDMLIRQVAETLPNLLHLGVLDMYPGYQLDCHHGGISQMTLRRFKRLESLILQVQHISHFVVDGVSQTHHSLDEYDGILNVGRDIMAACPTLRRAAISANVTSVRGGILTRSLSDGAIHEEPTTWLVVQASSMF
ncbi:hypothetical protein R3P38DRAFT_691461 [Favolaschia claudopus]|uniref:F-box domain-containing protein n=1 Tax=Favolaschia claudopus TaxID=2862362 RepID=A0AAW0EAY2_9AGAR